MPPCAEHMRIGTAAVRGHLSSAGAHITDKQIQEALWHYYYDVDKTVVYLVTTHVAKPKKEPKKDAAGRSVSLCMNLSTLDSASRER